MEKRSRDVLCQDYEEVEEVLVGFQLKGDGNETLKLYNTMDGDGEKPSNSLYPVCYTRVVNRLFHPPISEKK